ncbi:uncharacterized protein LOC131220691 [Magnolia sinica]|uniref:uncharacterized protein LOC131220691 n=1 Tax=Magnolia sinica TaxID=86752 RepID=UPI002658B88D|nr:uncharacterized protein LOC131220691 [Magnolia sinica]
MASDPVVCPTNLVHITPSDRNSNMEDSINDSDDTDADIYNGQTEFWELVFCKGDTDHIEKIIHVDLDKDIDSTEPSNGSDSSSSKHKDADHRRGEHGGTDHDRTAPGSTFLTQECPRVPSFSRLVSATGPIGRCPVRSSPGSDCIIRDEGGPFEFPTLRREWNGSPTRMPNANRKQWKKQRRCRFSQVWWHI